VNPVSWLHACTIGNLIENFKTFLKTKEGQEWQKDREDRAALFERLLAKDRIENLTEKDFLVIQRISF